MKKTDEMCNFYIMFWVKGNQTTHLGRSCFTPGPPLYYWSTDKRFKNWPKGEFEKDEKKEGKDSGSKSSVEYTLI